MKDIGDLIGICLTLFSIISGTFGFSLKTRWGILIILCAFVGGFLMGYFEKDLASGIGMGIILAVLAILMGPVILRNRQRFRK